MLSVALLCCLALLGGAHGASVPDPEPYEEEPHLDDGDDNIKDMLAHLEGEMNQLVSKYMHLSEEFADKVHDREAAQTKASNLKLRMAKGDHVCKKGFFRCASAEDQCVSDMLVCDGEKDCHDGSDEDEHVCTDPITPGTLYEGRALYDHCTQRRPQHVSIEIQSDDREAYWPSRIHVNANLHMEATHGAVTHHDNLPISGYYYFAKHYAIFDPPEEDMLGIIAEFDPGNDEIMMAYVQHEDEDEPCAEFDLRLVHH